MLQDIDLRSLSEHRGNGRDVVSAYFSAKDGLSKLKRRESQILDLLDDDPLEAENFRRSMDTIRDLLANHQVGDAESVCFFCSEILDLAEGYPISMPVDDLLIVSSAPYIRPLAELQDEYETFAIVCCDNDRSRILTVTNEQSEVETAIRGGVKNHVRKGGWSQQRYERRRDEQLARYAEEVGEALGAVVKQHQIDRIVLLGSDETMRAIEEGMTEELVEKIVGREKFDLKQGDDQILERAYESYFEDERAFEKDLWLRIKDESMRGGRAVTGLEATLENVLVGRVEAAVVTRDAKLTGSKCRSCEKIDVHQTVQCRGCGSDEVFKIDVIDVIARQIELTSGHLDFVDPLPGLTKVGDIAALLRY